MEFAAGFLVGVFAGIFSLLLLPAWLEAQREKHQRRNVLAFASRAVPQRTAQELYSVNCF
jgi:hypothetical protein